jgi:hypothetical protein
VPRERERGATKRGNCRGCPPGRLAFAIRTRCCCCFSAGCARGSYFLRVCGPPPPPPLSHSAATAGTMALEKQPNLVARRELCNWACIAVTQVASRPGALRPERERTRAAKCIVRRSASPPAPAMGALCVFFSFCPLTTLSSVRPGIYMALFASTIRFRLCQLWLIFYDSPRHIGGFNCVEFQAGKLLSA